MAAPHPAPRAYGTVSVAHNLGPVAAALLSSRSRPWHRQLAPSSIRSNTWNLLLTDSLYSDVGGGPQHIFSVLPDSPPGGGECVAPFQLVNHLPNSPALTNKASLIRALNRLLQSRGAGEHVFDAIPVTYVLTGGVRSEAENPVLAQFFKRHAAMAHGNTDGCHMPPRQCAGNLWIVKQAACGTAATAAVCGTAAEVKTIVHAMPKGSDVVVQKLIESPLCVLGRKCTLRLWLAVTDSGDVFLYRPGMHAVLAAAPFQPGCSLGTAPPATVQAVHVASQSLPRTSGSPSILSLEELAAALDAEDGAAGRPALRGSALLTLVLPRMQRVAAEVVAGAFAASLPPLAGYVEPSASAASGGSAHPRAGHRGRRAFELFGLDFQLEGGEISSGGGGGGEALRPWLLGLSENPCLDTTGPRTRLVATMAEGLVALAVDPLFPDPESGYATAAPEPAASWKDLAPAAMAPAAGPWRVPTGPAALAATRRQGADGASAPVPGAPGGSHPPSSAAGPGPLSLAQRRAALFSDLDSLTAPHGSSSLSTAPLPAPQQQPPYEVTGWVLLHAAARSPGPDGGPADVETPAYVASQTALASELYAASSSSGGGGGAGAAGRSRSPVRFGAASSAGASARVAARFGGRDPSAAPPPRSRGTETVPPGAFFGGGGGTTVPGGRGAPPPVSAPSPGSSSAPAQPSSGSSSQSSNTPSAAAVAAGLRLQLLSTPTHTAAASYASAERASPAPASPPGASGISGGGGHPLLGAPLGQQPPPRGHHHPPPTSTPIIESLRAPGPGGRAVDSGGGGAGYFSESSGGGGGGRGGPGLFGDTFPRNSATAPRGVPSPSSSSSSQQQRQLVELLRASVATLQQPSLPPRPPSQQTQQQQTHPSSFGEGEQEQQGQQRGRDRGRSPHRRRSAAGGSSGSRSPGGASSGSRSPSANGQRQRGGGARSSSASARARLSAVAPRVDTGQPHGSGRPHNNPRSASSGSSGRAGAAGQQQLQPGTSGRRESRGSAATTPTPQSTGPSFRSSAPRGSGSGAVVDHTTTLGLTPKNLKAGRALVPRPMANSGFRTPTGHGNGPTDDSGRQGAEEYDPGVPYHQPAALRAGTSGAPLGGAAAVPSAVASSRRSSAPPSGALGSTSSSASRVRFSESGAGPSANEQQMQQNQNQQARVAAPKGKAGGGAGGSKAARLAAALQEAVDALTARRDAAIVSSAQQGQGQQQQYRQQGPAPSSSSSAAAYLRGNGASLPRRPVPLTAPLENEYSAFTSLSSASFEGQQQGGAAGRLGLPPQPHRHSGNPAPQQRQQQQPYQFYSEGAAEEDPDAGAAPPPPTSQQSSSGRALAGGLRVVPAPEALRGIIGPTGPGQQPLPLGWRSAPSAAEPSAGSGSGALGTALLAMGSSQGAVRPSYGTGTASSSSSFLSQVPVQGQSQGGSRAHNYVFSAPQATHTAPPASSASSFAASSAYAHLPPPSSAHSRGGLALPRGPHAPEALPPGHAATALRRYLVDPSASSFSSYAAASYSAAPATVAPSVLAAAEAASAQAEAAAAAAEQARRAGEAARAEAARAAEAAAIPARNRALLQSSQALIKESDALRYGAASTAIRSVQRQRDPRDQHTTTAAWRRGGGGGGAPDPLSGTFSGPPSGAAAPSSRVVPSLSPVPTARVTFRGSLPAHHYSFGASSVVHPGAGGQGSALADGGLLGEEGEGAVSRSGEDRDTGAGASPRYVSLYAAAAASAAAATAGASAAAASMVTRGAVGLFGPEKPLTLSETVTAPPTHAARRREAAGGEEALQPGGQGSSTSSSNPSSGADRISLLSTTVLGAAGGRGSGSLALGPQRSRPSAAFQSHDAVAGTAEDRYRGGNGRDAIAAAVAAARSAFSVAPAKPASAAPVAASAAGGGREGLSGSSSGPADAPGGGMHGRQLWVAVTPLGASLPYYYHGTTRETRWERPTDPDVVIVPQSDLDALAASVVVGSA